MAIKVGDRVPEGSFKHVTSDGLGEISTKDVFPGKKVVLFSVPGAFTPTCSGKHLPGYLRDIEKFKAKGVDAIVCLAVNDPFVMDAWAKAHNVGDKIVMLPDGNGEYAKKLGLEFDGSGFGLGVRSQRFSMIIEDGVVKQLNIEPPGAFGVSSAEETVCQL